MSIDNVMVIIGDNNATNLAIAKMIFVEFIGCASHHFKLAINDLTTDYAELVEDVRSIMQNLRTPKLAATLIVKTKMSAKVSNTTL